MMNRIKIVLYTIVVYSSLLAACTLGPQVRPSEAEPEAPPLDGPKLPVGEYEFTMTANFKDESARIPDTMNSKWDGKFTIDSDGKIEGKGTFTYTSQIFLMNKSLSNCGYYWDHSGEGEFSLGGTVNLDKNSIPLELLSWSVIGDGITSEPVLVCPGWEEAIMPLVKDDWVPSRRFVVLDSIYNHFWVIKNQLKADETIEKQGSSVYMKIKITAPIPLAPLPPKN